MTAEERLVELGLTLPQLPAAAGLYAPCVQSGSLLFISGQIPLREGRPMAQGKVGARFTADEAAVFARQCALQGLAAARSHLGSLDRVTRVVKVTGFVASAPGFTEQPKVINGASALLIDVFGEAGKHARAAVGLAELPLGVPVEVEFIFEVA
ncbi:MAG: RidA family protein [Dehalococcoidia bacterium]